MKTKRITGIGLVAGLLLLLAGDALAFYNPQTGRWLSRDPLFSDVAFSTLTTLDAIIPSNQGEDSGGSYESGERALAAGNAENLYSFSGNRPLSLSDLLGLLTATGGTPHTSPIRHNNYLTFNIQCPACTQLYLSGIDYSPVTPCLIGLGYTASYLASLGTLGGPVTGTPTGVNCTGDAVTVQAYMRSRLSYYGKSGAVACYASGTRVNYSCQNTCNSPPCCRFQRVITQ